MKRMFYIVFILCIAQGAFIPVWADTTGSDILDALSRHDADIKSSSSSRMEETLSKLRENTQEAVVANKKLSEKNQRFRERVAELEKESAKLATLKPQLLEKRDAVQEQLKKEVAQTQLMQNEIEKLNSNIASSDQQELSVKNAIISKDVEQETIKKHIDNMRTEINNEREKVSFLKASGGIQHSQEFLQQKNILNDQLAALEQARSLLDSARSEAQRLSDAMRNVRAKKNDLMEKQNSLVAELADSKDQGRRLQDFYAQRLEKENRDAQEIDAQIAKLTAQRSELMEAGKQAQLLQKGLALSIPEERLREDAANLVAARDLLKKQADLLIAQLTLLTPRQENNTGSDLKKLQERVATLDKEQNDLLQLVAQKGRESKQAEDTLAGLQEFVPRIKKAFLVLKERNDHKLQMEEDRIAKEYAARGKARMSLMDKNAMLKDRLLAVRNQMDDLVLVGNKLSQEQQDKVVHGTYDLEKLKAELTTLELNKDYLSSTLKAVRAKLKDSNNAVLPWSNNEEMDLKNHVTSLRQENKHLQVELLSISMEKDRVNSGKQSQGGMEKNL